MLVNRLEPRAMKNGALLAPAGVAKLTLMSVPAGSSPSLSKPLSSLTKPVSAPAAGELSDSKVVTEVPGTVKGWVVPGPAPTATSSVGTVSSRVGARSGKRLPSVPKPAAAGGLGGGGQGVGRDKGEGEWRERVGQELHRDQQKKGPRVSAGKKEERGDAD